LVVQIYPNSKYTAINSRRIPQHVFQDIIGKNYQIVDMVFDDVNQQIDIQLLILMDQDIAKSDHAFQMNGEFGRDNPCLGKNVERFLAFFGKSKFLLGLD